jgi:hypothetical protein
LLSLQSWLSITTTFKPTHRKVSGCIAVEGQQIKMPKENTNYGFQERLQKVKTSIGDIC